MSNFEDFVKNNREEFDKFEPGPVVWHNVQQHLKRPEEKKGILISMKVLRWSAAAAIILALGAGTWYFMEHNKKNPADSFAGKEKIAPSNNLPVPEQQPKQEEAPLVAENQNSSLPKEKKVENTTASKDEQLEESNEEMVHYARLIEIKQNQIKKIKKDEPVLYQQFAGDFNKLDSTFHILKKQLPVNPNREQILEAMIQNLQYQEALLNQQLNIIKKINNTKKEAYEKAYRSA